MEDLSRYKNIIETKCKECNSEFFSRAAEIKRGKAKFCSKKCYGINKQKTSIGDKNSAWKGGIMKRVGLYSYLRSGVKQYIAEHRKVMSNFIGRDLKKTEIVHHFDGDKSNNNIKNLCLMKSLSAHSRLHSFAKRNGIEIKHLIFPQPWLSKG